jgi:hypothetical protein
MRNAIRSDPLRPVAEIYEEVFSDVKNNLDGTDKEEFVSLCPNFQSMEGSLYRGFVCTNKRSGVLCIPTSIYRSFKQRVCMQQSKTKVISLFDRWRREHIPATPDTQEEIDIENRWLLMSIIYLFLIFYLYPICLIFVLLLILPLLLLLLILFLRYFIDYKDNPLVVGDYQYPGEPNGRILVISSVDILEWLGQRQRDGLSTISRLAIDATFKVLKYL